MIIKGGDPPETPRRSNYQGGTTPLKPPAALIIKGGDPPETPRRDYQGGRPP